MVPGALLTMAVPSRRAQADQDHAHGTRDLRLPPLAQATKAEAELDASSPAPRATDPADELRQKLAESRVDEADDEPTSEESVEDRRTEVHEQGRAALDEMKPSDEG